MLKMPKMNYDGPPPTTVIAVTVLIAIFVMTGILRWQQAGFGVGQVTIGDGNVVRVDVAASDVTRERGLSGRASIGPDEGMLFVFPIAAQYTFWMKDMRFPIDAIWVKDGRIIDMSIGMAVPASDKDLPVYFPKSPADAVVELPAGYVKEHGLRLGMSVTMRIDRRGALR